jgi:serine/threonine-protein kinase
MSDPLAHLRTALGKRYRIEHELGRGGMATVYRAEDLKHGRLVAIKVLRPGLVSGGEELDRFLREIHTIARLTHPQILPLFDSGQVEVLVPRVPGRRSKVEGGSESTLDLGPTTLPFYVMPFIAGSSLRTRLERERQLPIDEAVRLARSVAGALDYAHRHDVLHRDIKPENILLHEGEPVVADFGVSRAITGNSGESVTEPGLAVGTPAYMSPEQASGDRELDGRSDQYALGCVLYEMLAGQPPFAGSSPQSTMARQAIEAPPPLSGLRPDVPPALEQVVNRTLAKDPGDRFATAADLAEALSLPLERVSGLFPGVGGTREAARAIAVLPFANLSADPDSEYFSDGMTDELINALAQVQGLRVASRTSVFALKTRREDVRTLGAMLGVSVVLEGTVRRAGSRLRITASLTSVQDGRLLWSERFDRELTDVFAIQDEITRTIVNTLRVTFLGPLGDPTPARYTANLRAYSLYLRGRYCWNQRTGGAIAEAISYFEQAIAEDPDYALAYTGLADCYALALDYRAVPVSEGMQRAREQAERALALDDTLAEAHTSLGWVTFIHQWDWPAAELHFRRAIELDPRYATARQWYSWYLAAQGRLPEALAQGKAAAELDFASVSIRRSMAWLHYYARRPEQGVEHLQRALAMNPTAMETHLILGLLYTQLGQYDEAEALLRDVVLVVGVDTHAIAALAHLAVLRGRREEAERLRAQLLQMQEDRYVSPTDLARAHIALGDHDQAFAMIERAREERRGWLAYLRVEPLLDPLRSDPRFGALLKRMKLD